MTAGASSKNPIGQRQLRWALKWDVAVFFGRRRLAFVLQGFQRLDDLQAGCGRCEDVVEIAARCSDERVGKPLPVFLDFLRPDLIGIFGLSQLAPVEDCLLYTSDAADE